MTSRPFPEIDEGSLTIDPVERSETIPSSWYVDPNFHDLDREAVFGRSWHLVGHEGRLADSGQFVSSVVAGEPIVVVRTGDGGLGGFFNVCRHRGGPLVTDECGRVGGVLKCQYHGWTYRLDGSLRGVPRFDRTELFDKRDYGLVPVRVESWQGLVFVALGGAVPPLNEVLDGIPERIAPMRLDGLSHRHTQIYDVACNWKVYVDNYLEGYHVPLVHPELNRLLDYRSYTTETSPWYSLQHSGLRSGGDGVSAGQEEKAYYYFLFPNVMLNILPGRLQTNVVEAVAHDRCRVRFDYYYDAGLPSGSDAAVAADIELSDRVQQEDIEICEHVQRGLGSRAYDRGRFSVEMERGVYHFQGLLKEAYRRALEDGR